MFQVEEEAGAVGLRPAGKWPVPGHELCDRQTRHPVVRQSQVALPLTPPYKSTELLLKYLQSATLVIINNSFRKERPKIQGI